MSIPLLNPDAFASQFSDKDMRFGVGPQAKAKYYKRGEIRPSEKQLVSREVKGMCIHCLNGCDDLCKDPDCPCICSEL